MCEEYSCTRNRMCDSIWLFLNAKMRARRRANDFVFVLFVFGIRYILMLVVL